MEQSVSFEEFQSSTYEDWKKRVLKELGEKPFESLQKINAEDLSIEAGYTHDHYGPVWPQSPVEMPYLFRHPAVEWEIRVDVSGSISQINQRALSALQGGATGIGIDCALHSHADLPKLLEGVYIEMISLHLMQVTEPEKWIQAYIDLARSRNLNLHELHGTIGYDWAGDPEGMSAVSAHFRTLPHVRFFTINALIARNEGASAASEIAHALAAGQEALHILTSSGIAIDDAAAMLAFQFGVGTEYFSEIAKYRSFRALWMEVLKAYSPKHECTFHAYVHAETSLTSLGQHDAASNLLRLTTEAMSAVLGGVNSLYVRSSDVSAEVPSDQSMRWSRNIQHLLRDECGLHLAIDPASGSWYLETLAGQLAERAWKAFIEIESQGGFLQNQSNLKEQYSIRRARVEEEISRGERVLVGENKYIKK